MAQYVVMYFPSDDLSASAAGPYRTYAKAQRVCETFDAVAKITRRRA